MTDPISFPPGKLPVAILERLIRTYTSSIHGVVVGASIGEDAAASDFGEKYLLMVEPSDSEKITRSLEEAGVPAAIIGKITEKEQAVKSRSEGRIKDLPRFDRDEITKILERA